MQLQDLKIIVTGGAQGMGAHFARRLQEAGAKVAVGDVNEQALAQLPDGIHRRRLDVSKEEEVTAFVAWAHEALGGLNALVNNAGILRDGLLVKRDRTTGAVTKPATMVLRDCLEARGVFGAVFCAPATSRNRTMVRLTLHAGLAEAELDHVEAVAADIAPLVKPWDWPIARRHQAAVRGADDVV